MLTSYTPGGMSLSRPTTERMARWAATAVLLAGLQWGCRNEPEPIDKSKDATAKKVAPQTAPKDQPEPGRAAAQPKSAETALPPGHPPMGEGAPSPKTATPVNADNPLPPVNADEPLPPGHPPIGGPPTPAKTAPPINVDDPLPPGHPPIGEMRPPDTAPPDKGPPPRDAPLDPISVPPPSLSEEKTVLDGVTLTVPVGWKQIEPHGSTQGTSFAPKAIFDLRGGPNDRAPVMVRVTHFPSMRQMPNLVDENLKRWCRMYQQPDGTPTADRAKVETMELGPCKVTVADIQGTFQNRPNYAMIAAIIEHDTGPYFLKAVGPAERVAQWRPSIILYLKSVKPNP